MNENSQNNFATNPFASSDVSTCSLPSPLEVGTARCRVNRDKAHPQKDYPSDDNAKHGDGGAILSRPYGDYTLHRPRVIIAAAVAGLAAR